MDSDNDRGGSVLDSVGSVSDLFTIDILRLYMLINLSTCEYQQSIPESLKDKQNDISKAGNNKR
ncbi:hypothetical protein GCM10007922_36830 [Shewanella decolorationis]|nr:hypothetical protein GCM10007922_36830 [Shewanella decolorationis]